MAETVERLVATLEADIRGFTKNMAEAQRLFDQRASAIERRQSALMRKLNSGFNLRGLQNTILGGAALIGIQRFVSTIANAAGQLQDASDALGISTDALQTWGTLAGRAGISQEQFNKAIGQFSARLGEAQLKGGQFKKFLDGIGVGTQGTPEEVFNRIADAVKNTSSQTQRAAIVAEAFTARAVRLTPILQQGSAALKAQGVELARNGQIMSREAIAKIDELGDKWEDLKRKFTAMGANALIPLLDEISSPAFQQGLSSFATTFSQVAVAIARMAPHIPALAGLIIGLRNGGPVGGAIGGLAGLTIEAYRRQTQQIQDSIAKLEKDLANAEARAARREPGAADQAAGIRAQIARQKAEALPFAPKDFPVAPTSGIDRTGTLFDPDDAKRALSKSFADLAAAQAALTRATGQANADVINDTALRYEAERQEIKDTTNAAIIAAEEKKQAAIAALDQEKIGRAAFNQIVQNLDQETAAEQAALLEKRRGELAKSYRQQYEDALALSRRLIDLEIDSQSQAAEARRGVITAQSDADIAIAVAEDRETALIEIQRRANSEAAALEEEALEERLARSLLELERQKEDLERAGEAFAEYQQTRVNLEQAAASKIEEIRKRLSTQSVELDKQEKDLRLKQADTFFGSLATLTRSSSKELQAIGKAAAIIQATIDGVLAVQKALASAPPPINFALAAAVGAAAAVNVAEIAGMEKGGRVSAGTPYIVGEKRPELFVPDTAGTIIPRIPSAMSPSGSSSAVININAPGAHPGVVDEAIRAVRREFPAWQAATIRRVERAMPRMMNNADRDYR